MRDEAGVETGRGLEERVRRGLAGPALGWALLVGLALPVAALVLVTVRGLTGHSAFFAGTVDQSTYSRVGAAVLSSGGATELVAPLIGLCLLVAAPAAGWIVAAPVRRVASGLAGVLALLATLQVGLLGYLFLADPPTGDGIVFIQDGTQVEQLSRPLAAAVCVAVLAGVVAVLLLRPPAAPGEPREDPHPAEDAPQDEDLPDVEDPPAPHLEKEPDVAPEQPAEPEDPYARYRRPRP